MEMIYYYIIDTETDDAVGVDITNILLELLPGRRQRHRYQECTEAEYETWKVFNEKELG